MIANRFERSQFPGHHHGRSAGDDSVVETSSQRRAKIGTFGVNQPVAPQSNTANVMPL